MSKPKLYSYWRSTASNRVRIALALKGIEYDYAPVNLLDGDQLDQPFMTINPQAQIPVLEIDGATLHQSMAILDYLEATHPSPPLLPSNPAEAAHARAFALSIASDIHPIQNLRVLKYVKGQYGQEQDGVNAWARHWISLGFGACETIAKRRSSAFLFSDAPGYGECVLVPQSYNAQRFGLDMTPFPALNEVIAACAEHPAFIAAHPRNQPDAPDEG